MSGRRERSEEMATTIEEAERKEPRKELSVSEARGAESERMVVKETYH
jgi:hypothetical protein